jgi:DNA-directed RNA polymerase subunit K/omega
MRNQLKKVIPHKTIEGQLKVVPNRYVLAIATMRRTKQLINGAKPGPHVNPLLTEDRGQMPFSRAIRVALEEIENGDIKVGKVPDPPKPVATLDNSVVFN